MLGVWKTFLLGRLAEWRLPAGGDWTFVIHNNYHPHYSNLNVMWFHDADTFPRVVVKFSNDHARLKKECENIQLAHKLAPALVPNPLHSGLQGHLWSLWMEGVPGSVLSTSKAPSPEILRSLVDMVASLHAAFRRVPQGVDKDRYQHMVQEPLQAVAKFGSSTAVTTGCSELASSISSQWLNSLPTIPQHGDLFAGNILSYRDRFYVVDWEGFGTIDLPFCDLFPLLYSFLRDSGKSPAMWSPTLIRQLPSLVRSYTQRLELIPDDVSLLLPLALTNWFYAHLKEGRKAFTNEMYRTIVQYFEQPEPWQQAFVPR
jgi:aminoglycoside phosphotransferase (APT) family kinase protein